QPLQHVVEPGLDRIDVPGGDLHGGGLSGRGPHGATPTPPVNREGGATRGGASPDREGGAAAAGGGGVRVLDREIRADQLVLEVELRARQQVQRDVVDHHLDAVTLEHMVVVVHGD